MHFPGDQCESTLGSFGKDRAEHHEDSVEEFEVNRAVDAEPQVLVKGNDSVT